LFYVPASKLEPVVATSAQTYYKSAIPDINARYSAILGLIIPLFLHPKIINIKENKSNGK